MITLVLTILCLGYIYEDSDSLIIDNDSLILCGNHFYNIRVHLRNNAKLKIRSWSGIPDTTGWLTVFSPVIKIEDSSSIHGAAEGYWGGTNSHADGQGPGHGSAGTSGGGGGGAYGGDGGDGGDTNPGYGGTAYGSASDTIIQMGSGGGAGRLSQVEGFGGNGGACIYLRAISVDLTNSDINMDGENGDDASLEAGGGGSGGGILIRADTLVLHAVNLTANAGSGGSASFGGGGGAGGGRIKLFYSILFDTTNLGLSVNPGTGGFGGYGNGEPGMPGTVYIGTVAGANLQPDYVIDASNTSYIARNSIRLSFHTYPTRFKIYDNSGRVAIKDIANSPVIIDISKLNQGVYFMKTDENPEKLHKLIVIR